MNANASLDARLPIDIGVLCTGLLSSTQHRLICSSARQLQTTLQHDLPDYQWRLHIKTRRDIGEFNREESSHLLRQAADERDTEHWDFVLLVTADELIARYRRFALAALSRPLDAAVISVSRLQSPPVGEFDSATTGLVSARADEPVAGDARRVDSVAEDTRTINRLATLMLHAIGHLGGLTDQQESDSVLYRPESPAELDDMGGFTAAQLSALQRYVSDIADTRLEDEAASSRSRLAFLLRASWINRDVIVDAVLAARPWQFPIHLNRLTTAAVSTVAILLMTAESWDLGLSQTPLSLVVMGLIIWLLTTGFVLTRQQLLLGRHRHLGEQIVVTRVSATLIVLAGLAITWLCLGGLALLAASALFEPALVQSWASSTDAGAAAPGGSTYVQMASFCASIGLLIGSLGASFEDQHHFQHVVFVDVEL